MSAPSDRQLLLLHELLLRAFELRVGPLGLVVGRLDLLRLCQFAVLRALTLALLRPVPHRPHEQHKEPRHSQREEQVRPPRAPPRRMHDHQHRLRRRPMPIGAGGADLEAKAARRQAGEAHGALRAAVGPGDDVGFVAVVQTVLVAHRVGLRVVEAGEGERYLGGVEGQVHAAQAGEPEGGVAPGGGAVGERAEGEQREPWRGPRRRAGRR